MERWQEEIGKMKIFASYLLILGTVLGVVTSYELYRHHLYNLSVEYVYGDTHYRLRQMASEDLLCKDSQGNLCDCGHCA